MRGSPAPLKTPTSLSPLSSRSAAEAERETIRYLRLECRGLSAALKHLKRDSKEWVLIKSRLDIASEELDCTLEDSSLFSNFSIGSAGSINADDCLSLIPTPPLVQKENATNAGIGSSSLNPTFSLRSKASITSHNTGDSNEVDCGATNLYPPLPLVASSIAPLESLENGVGNCQAAIADPCVHVLHRKVSPGIVIDTKEIGNGITGHVKSLPGHSAKQVSPESRRRLTKESQYRQPKRRGGPPKARNKNEDGHLIARVLSAKLETVPKYSLEWFTLKKKIAAAIKNEEWWSATFGADTTSQSHRSDKINENNIGEAKSETWSSCENGKHQLQLADESQCNALPSDGVCNDLLKSHTEQLKRLPKYSLDWFQMKKEIEALKNKMRHSTND